MTEKQRFSPEKAERCVEFLDGTLVAIPTGEVIKQEESRK